jgi:translation initiation factor 4A
MNAATKLSALNRFRSAAAGLVRQLTTKILVVYDVQIKNPEVSHVPLVINYGEFYTRNAVRSKIILTWFAFLDLPKAVEEYAHRYGVHNFVFFFTPEFTYPPASVAAAVAPSHARAGVIVNFVTATGGDVEMLRSIECFYK